MKKLLLAAVLAAANTFVVGSEYLEVPSAEISLGFGQGQTPDLAKGSAYDAAFRQCWQEKGGYPLTHVFLSVNKNVAYIDADGIAHWEWAAIVQMYCRPRQTGAA